MVALHLLHLLRTDGALMDFGYQEIGVEFLRSHDHAYLGDEAGLGKSRQLALAAEGDTLIVAPAMVLDGGVWTGELAKWRPDLDATQVSYHGLFERNDKGGIPKNDKGDPVIKPRPDLVQHWDTVIFDEAHYLKGRKTAWTVAAEQICKRADRVYLASGTPIPNWAHELYMPLRLMHPSDKRFTSYWRWIETWFYIGRNRFTRYDVTGDLLACGPRCLDVRLPDVCEHWQAFYDSNFGDRMLRRMRDDVLKDLPPLTRQVIDCPMTPEQERTYRKLKKDFIAFVEETGSERLMWSDASKYVALMQCTTGLPSLDAGATKGSGKLEVLEQILVGRGHPSLVLAYYKNTAAAIARMCEQVGLRYATLGSASSKKQRLDTVRRFQAGDFDVLIGSIEVVAEGLTLTKADTVIFVERHWRPSRNEQAMRRVHRIGQDRPVTCIELRTPKSLDLGMTALLEGKSDNQARALTPSQLAAVA